MSENAQGDLHEIHTRLLATLWKEWIKHRDENKQVDPPRYSRLSVVTLSHVAATVAVDVGMDLEQFLAVCRANFKDAYQRAPKWG